MNEMNNEQMRKDAAKFMTPNPGSYKAKNTPLGGAGKLNEAAYGSSVKGSHNAPYFHERNTKNLSGAQPSGNKRFTIA